MLIIPFSGQASFSQEVTLDGVPYRFRFDWNEFSGAWTMSIYDRKLVPLVAGIKIVLDYELIGDYRYRGLPKGEIYAVEKTNTLRKIGRNDLGDLAYLAYVNNGEVL